MKPWMSIAIAIVTAGGAAAMYFIGNNSSHLSELQSYYWTPLPLTAISLISLFTKKKNQ